MEVPFERPLLAITVSIRESKELACLQVQHSNVDACKIQLAYIYRSTGPSTFVAKLKCSTCGGLLQVLSKRL